MHIQGVEPVLRGHFLKHWINDVIKMRMNYDIDIQFTKLTMQIDASSRYL